MLGLLYLLVVLGSLAMSTARQHEQRPVSTPTRSERLNAVTGKAALAAFVVIAALVVAGSLLSIG